MNSSTVSRTPRRSDNVVVRIADIAIVCFAFFAFGIAVMHVIRPDDAVSTHMISDYAVGPWGGVMTAAFSSASLGSLMLALGVARSRPTSLAGWSVAVLLALTSMCLAVTAAFPSDPHSVPSMTTGGIHAISVLINIASLLLAAVITAFIAIRDPRWRTHRLAAGFLAVILVIAVAVQFMTLHRGLSYGTANRFLVGAMTAWFFVTALRLRRLASLAI